jgi:hypothetical protein
MEIMKRSARMKKIFANEEAQAIVSKWIPEFFKDPRVKMAGMMTIQGVFDQIPTDSLNEADREALYEELEALPEE